MLGDEHSVLRRPAYALFFSDWAPKTNTSMVAINMIYMIIGETYTLWL